MLERNGRAYEVGDVVWTVDPFKLGRDRSRLFAIICTRTHPFEGEQFIGVTVTTTDHLVAHPLEPHHWEVGGTPEQSYILPLSIHTPRADNIQAPKKYDEINDPWQGRLTDKFVKRVIDELIWTIRKYE
jgi:hypothetical protein